jgi:hypothetical protein
MNTATAKKIDDATPAPPRKQELIDPANAQIDWQGFVRKSVFVRLPSGMVADMLKEPKIWEKVQRSKVSLRQHDHVYMVSFDQDWVAEAIVSQADTSSVTLAGIKIAQTPQRIIPLFRDDTYAVKWNGAGYYVERISDGHPMTQPTANAKLAERDLANLYPKQV